MVKCDPRFHLSRGASLSSRRCRAFCFCRKKLNLLTQKDTPSRAPQTRSEGGRRVLVTSKLLGLPPSLGGVPTTSPSAQTRSVGHSTDRLDIRAARVLLDNDHYAMEKLKKRVLEYLAVRQLRNNLKGPILCFVGPPGVGKTSVGRSVAKTLGREFHRIALGGVCDQSDIRGHRWVLPSPACPLLPCGWREPPRAQRRVPLLPKGLFGVPGEHGASP